MAPSISTSGISWPRYWIMWRPFDSSILVASSSSRRVTSDSGTAFGCCEPARNTSSEVSWSADAPRIAFVLFGDVALDAPAVPIA